MTRVAVGVVDSFACDARNVAFWGKDVMGAGVVSYV